MNAGDILEVYMQNEFINLFSSVIVMFFIFFIIVKWFLNSFERRIVFIESLYNDMRQDIKSLSKELHLLNETLRDFRIWFANNAKVNSRSLLDEEVDYNG